MSFRVRTETKTYPLAGEGRVLMFCFLAPEIQLLVGVYMKNVIQIAGIRSCEEARMVASCGVTHVGFPLCLAYHKEDMTAADVRTVINDLPDHVTPVLITYLHDPLKIVELAGYLGVSVIQLHGRVLLEEMALLRKMAPALCIIKSLIIGDKNWVELEKQVLGFAPSVDVFLTDTFDFSTGACGATGKVHDWNISKKIVELSPRPLILAGGLTPANVCSGIKFVRPLGVDAHSGVEDVHGNKDPALLERFVAEAMVGFLG